jgi:hypothetical protein
MDVARPKFFRIPVAAWIILALWSMLHLAIALRVGINAQVLGRLTADVLLPAIIPLVITWPVWLVCRRSQRVATFTLIGVMVLLMLGALTSSVQKSAQAAEAPAPQSPAAIPFTIVWPDGWTVTQLPTPDDEKGNNFGGQRSRAILTDKGTGLPLAAIEAAYFPRRASVAFDLDSDFAAAMKVMEKEFSRRHQAMELSGQKVSTLANMPAREATTVLTAPQGKVRMWITLASTPGYIFQLQYAAAEPYYERYLATFERAKQSLVLQ